MESFFPFGKQRAVPPISRDEIDAFNMERFTFAETQLPPGKAVGSAGAFEAMRDASLRLIEAALGTQREELPKVSEETLRRYTASGDEEIW